MIKTKKTSLAAKVPAKKAKTTKKATKAKKDPMEMDLEELMKIAPKITPKVEAELTKMSPKARETMKLVTLIAIRAIQRVQHQQTILDLLETAVAEKEKTSKKKTSTSGTKVASRTRKSGAKTTS